MRNYSYRATSSDWTKIYDASVTGDFNGFIQSVNGFPASIIVSATTPTPSDVGVLIDDDPINITIRASDSENLYARIHNNGNASVLSMLSLPWSIVGGAASVGSAPTANPVGVSGIDSSGLKRSLLTDSTGQMMTTEQDSDVFTASATSASVLFTVDMTNWRSVLLQVTNAGSSCTVIYEGTNDNITWNTVVGLLANPNTATAASSNLAPTTSTAALTYQFPKRYKYFRARVSVYGSGTVSVSYCLSASEVSPVIVASVLGQVAEGIAFSGNPVTIGVECRTVRKPAVGNGQIVRPIGTVDGKLIVRSHSIPENEWKYVAASGGIVNTSTPVTLAAAGGAGLSIYITSMQIRAQALTNATEIVLRDGTSANYWLSEIGTAGMPLTNITFEDPIKLVANSSLTFSTLTPSGAGAVYINAQGYYAP